MEARIHLDHNFLAVEQEHVVHCMLEIEVPDAPAVDRVPLHLALVVDRSGSMAGPKLAAALDCGRFLASKLQPTDRLAVVAFDDDVQLVAPLAPVDPIGIASRIASIEPGGMTNLSGGWLKGIEEVSRASGDDATRRVLLLTDGHANVGVTRRHQLLQIAGASKEHAGTTTIGFGEDFDEDVLRAIAETSNANTYFAETPEDAPGIFAEEFEGLATLVAQNLSVEIRPTSDVELVGVLNEYPTVGVPDGVQLQLGDAYGSERRRLVFELHVPELAALGPARVAEVVLRYVTVGGETAAHEVTVPVVVNLVSADDPAAAEIDTEVTEEVWMLQAARARREAIDHIDHGDVDGSAARLLRTAASLRAHSPSAARSGELLAEAEALESHAERLDEQDPMWRKRVHQEQWRRNRGRRG